MNTSKRLGSATANFLYLVKTVSFSNFDYVSFCDQDDIWYTDKLKISLQQMHNRNLDFFSSDVLAIWDDGKKRKIKKSYPLKKYDHFFEAAGPGCTYVAKASLFEEFQKFIMRNPKKSTSDPTRLAILCLLQV